MQEGNVFWNSSSAEAETVQCNPEMDRKIRDESQNYFFSNTEYKKAFILRICICSTHMRGHKRGFVRKKSPGHNQNEWIYSSALLDVLNKGRLGVMLTAQCKEVKGVLLFGQYQLEGLFLCSLILQYAPPRETPSEYWLKSHVGVKCKELFLYEWSILCAYKA